jgi:hypothetical protein
VVASVIIETMDSLKLKYPNLSGVDKRVLAESRKALENE